MMQRHRKITLERFEKFISPIYFKDVNLRGQVYPADLISQSSVKLQVAGPTGRIKYDEALKLEYRDCKVGDTFGPSWVTFWFKVDITVPNDERYQGKEIHFVWDSDSEALIWENGVPIQAFTGGDGCDRRSEYILTKEYKRTDGVFRSFYIEMACNGMFGNGVGINPPDENRRFTLKQAEIAVFDREAYDLLVDFDIIASMAQHLPESSQRGSQALFVANEMVNAFDRHDRSTWKKAKEIAAKFFSDKNGPSQHNINAIGHCHIDVAWLWPYDETKRKAARSFATQILYMDNYPDYKFVQSQAQLYEWTKQLYPELYEKLKEKVKNGQFVITGGTWVEMDGNIPSGESFVRQFLFGQRFFKKEFGQYCTEFWLPDTFGYTAQLPQIIRGAGMDCFITQKLSWNLINKFPNSTFYWEGLDGSRVLTHFPPADTYNAQATVKETLFNVENFKDKERLNESLYLFGNGDGGGGPTVDMLERLDRMRQDVEGLPRVKYATPKEFFDICKQKAGDNLLSWVGELYLEFHRGTYTSQAQTKYYNRKSEFLLRDVELLSILATRVSSSSSGFDYPASALERLWKLVLLNQFHDVLPGSSIHAVYEDALRFYQQIQKEGLQLRANALSSLFARSEGFKHFVTVNTLGWNRTEVVEMEGDSTPDSYDQPQQTAHNGKRLIIADAPPIGYRLDSISIREYSFSAASVSHNEKDNEFILENEFVRVMISAADGTVLSMFDKKTKHEAISKIAAGGVGNLFVLFEDAPLFWDAWDVEVYHLEKRRKALYRNAKVRIVEEGPLRVALELTCDITETSKVKQIISLCCTSARLDFDTEVDWQRENRTFLKVEFPLNIRSSEATYDIPFGCIKRPTHFNTSWDLAKFEVCGHKWADLSEHGFGVALINDCKYGYSTTQGNVMRLSLLRSPKAPDDLCDIGLVHRIKYALFPHGGSTPQEGGVVQQAYSFNVPLLVVNNVDAAAAAAANDAWVSFIMATGDTRNNVVIDTVKKAEDSSDIVVRLFEAYGGRGRVTLHFHRNKLPVKRVTRCNLLEEDISDEELASASSGQFDADNNAYSFDINPYQIITLKLSL